MTKSRKLPNDGPSESIRRASRARQDAISRIGFKTRLAESLWGAVHSLPVYAMGGYASWDNQNSQRPDIVIGTGDADAPLDTYIESARIILTYNQGDLFLTVQGNPVSGSSPSPELEQMLNQRVIVNIHASEDPDTINALTLQREGLEYLRFKEFAPQTSLRGAEKRVRTNEMGYFETREIGWDSDDGSYSLREKGGFEADRKELVKTPSRDNIPSENSTYKASAMTYRSDVPLEEAIDDFMREALAEEMEVSRVHIYARRKERGSGKVHTVRLDSEQQGTSKALKQIIGRDLNHVTYISDPRNFEAVMFKADNDNGTYSLVRMREYAGDKK